ncbi:hypothetical protein Pan216_06850 [Planctomycetes bacterium Pan216]|uniref:DUF1559 domain-containing protein n=1 Tax=Kolteria novifilia TaxID=2527975 RepID=A0A518AYQ6_9BACT|nr:hypothetical protein Pan216_06850 [Planctomycetes bacterium Pan216]
MSVLRTSVSGARGRPAFTLVELLVVIAIIGTLVALLLPAVQQAREAARRTQCQNKLKQLGVALHAYHESHRFFPPGTITDGSGSPSNVICNIHKDSDAATRARAPWAVMILPYLDDQALYDRFNFDGRFLAYADCGGTQAVENYDVQFQRNSSFECPSDPLIHVGRARSTYFGVMGGGNDRRCTTTSTRRHWTSGIFWNNSKVGLSQITDGSANVFMIGESKYQPMGVGNPALGCDGSWAGSVYARASNHGQAATLAGAEIPINSVTDDVATNNLFVQQSRLFGSHHPGGCHFTMADGSVHFVTEGIDLTLYQTLAVRDDSAPLETNF